MSKHGTGYPKVQVTFRPNEIDILKDIRYTHTDSVAAAVRAFTRYCIIHKEQVLQFIEDHPELSRR